MSDCALCALYDTDMHGEPPEGGVLRVIAYQLDILDHELEECKDTLTQTYLNHRVGEIRALLDQLLDNR